MSGETMPKTHIQIISNLRPNRLDPGAGARQHRDTARLRPDAAG